MGSLQKKKTIIVVYMLDGSVLPEQMLAKIFENFLIVSRQSVLDELLKSTQLLVFVRLTFEREKRKGEMVFERTWGGSSMKHLLSS